MDAAATPVFDAQGARPQVVIVDDDPVAARLVARQLENSGIDATWGSLVLSRLEDEVRSLRPQLVLLDLQLGAESPDGVELGVALRRRFPALLIGVCTGSEDPTDAARALSAGMRSYLTKRWLLGTGPDRVWALVLLVLEGALVYMVDPWAKSTVRTRWR